MTSTLRIQVLLESELRRHLDFGVIELENETDPGRADLARGDHVRYKVVARNNGDLPFRRVSGFLSETRFASFRPERFEIQDLRPREEAVVGEIEARILENPSDYDGSDWLARVTLIATAAIDDVTIREAERAVTYRPSRRGRPLAATPRSVPLSS